MDYQRIYDEFIADRRSKEADLIASGEYFERHHVVPRSMGGADDASNLIALTAGDHYFAHLCLAKAHGGRQWAAAFMMSNRLNSFFEVIKHKPAYAMARKGFAKFSSASFSGEGNPMFGVSINIGSDNGNAQSVINLDTGEAFATITDAVIALGLPHSAKSKIGEVCRGKRRKTAGFRWAFFDGDAVAAHKAWDDQEVIRAGKRYAANYARGAGRRGVKLTEAERAELSLRLTGTKKPSLCKCVVNLCTGVVYDSVAKAAKSASISPAVVSNNIAGRSKTAGGFRWAYA